MTYPQPPSGSTWPAPPAPQKPTGPRRWPWITGIAAAFVVGLAIGNAGDASTAPVAQSSPPATHSAPTYSAPTYSAPVVTAEPEPAAPDGSFTNGIYEVGDEVAPGEYKSVGPEPGAFGLCYIHVKSGEHYLEQKVVNDGQVRIKILPSWAGAELDVSGCQPFAKVG